VPRRGTCNGPGGCRIDRESLLLERAARLSERIKPLLLARQQRVFDAWPVDRYMALLDRYPRFARLGYVSPAVRKACRQISGMVGNEGLELYHRMLLLTLIPRALRLLPARHLPDDVFRLYLDNYERIMTDIESTMEERTLYRYPLSPFCKDLSLCTLRLIPAGVEKVNLSRLPRRIFFTAGLRGGLDALRFVLFDQRGLRPYYEMHLHSQDLEAKSHFNPQGWMEFYVRIADLLRGDPEIKGVFGTAWFRDPALAAVSPHLTYLRTLMTDNGARIYSLGRCKKDGIVDATSTSRTRRSLYERGEYTPRNYLVVWPRQSLLAWADTHPERAIGSSE